MPHSRAAGPAAGPGRVTGPHPPMPAGPRAGQKDWSFRAGRGPGSAQGQQGQGGGKWRPKFQMSTWPRKAREARAPRHAGSPPGWVRGTPTGKTWGSWGVGFGRRGDRCQLGLSSPGLFPCVRLGQSRGEGVRRACTHIARTDRAEGCGPAGHRAGGDHCPWGLDRAAASRSALLGIALGGGTHLNSGALMPEGPAVSPTLCLANTGGFGAWLSSSQGSRLLGCPATGILPGWCPAWTPPPGSPAGRP